MITTLDKIAFAFENIYNGLRGSFQSLEAILLFLVVVGAFAVFQILIFGQFYLVYRAIKFIREFYNTMTGKSDINDV